LTSSPCSRHYIKLKKTTITWKKSVKVYKKIKKNRQKKNHVWINSKQHDKYVIYKNHALVMKSK